MAMTYRRCRDCRWVKIHPIEWLFGSGGQLARCSNPKTMNVPQVKERYHLGLERKVKSSSSRWHYCNALRGSSVFSVGRPGTALRPEGDAFRAAEALVEKAPAMIEAIILFGLLVVAVVALIWAALMAGRGP